MQSELKQLDGTAEGSIILLDDRQKVIYGILVIIAVAVLMLGSFSSFYSSVYALSLQSSNAHHKVFDKKQDSGTRSKDARNDGGGDGSSDNSGGGSSSSRSDKTLGHRDDSSSDNSIDGSSSTSDTRSSDSSNNLGNSDNNNNKNNNDQGTKDGGNTGENQGTGDNIPLTGTDTPTPQTTCEHGSNCTDQQGLSDRDRSTTATTDSTKQDDNAPFVLSLPFP